jgi:hypothetical protein
MPDLLSQMVKGYFLTISVETLVLLVGLSRRHPVSRRFAAGVWLTACTYPLLWLVLPVFIPPQSHTALYLAVGESLVPLAECALFWLAFQRGRNLSARERWRDWISIVLANLASFGLGELYYSLGYRL